MNKSDQKNGSLDDIVAHQINAACFLWKNLSGVGKKFNNASST